MKYGKVIWRTLLACGCILFVTYMVISGKRADFKVAKTENPRYVHYDSPTTETDRDVMEARRNAHWSCGRIQRNRRPTSSTRIFSDRCYNELRSVDEKDLSTSKDYDVVSRNWRWVRGIALSLVIADPEKVSLFFPKCKKYDAKTNSMICRYWQDWWNPLSYWPA